MLTKSTCVLVSGVIAAPLTVITIHLEVSCTEKLQVEKTLHIVGVEVVPEVKRRKEGSTENIMAPELGPMDVTLSVPKEYSI